MTPAECMSPPRRAVCLRGVSWGGDDGGWREAEARGPPPRALWIFLRALYGGDEGGWREPKARGRLLRTVCFVLGVLAEAALKTGLDSLMGVQEYEVLVGWGTAKLEPRLCWVFMSMR
jgi:hypothetical protein